VIHRHHFGGRNASIFCPIKVAACPGRPHETRRHRAERTRLGYLTLPSTVRGPHAAKQSHLEEARVKGGGGRGGGACGVLVALDDLEDGVEHLGRKD
jgi:hypothetical protein